MTQQLHIFFLFFFNDTATTEIYTLSLHDALPISINIMTLGGLALAVGILVDESTVVMENIHSHLGQGRGRDRKSTRLNSSHGYISYAVFCLKKKKTQLNIRDHETFTKQQPHTHDH